jgi:hypothetical protein
VEDTLHMTWNCPKSGKVWDWVSKLMQFASEAAHLGLPLAFSTTCDTCRETGRKQHNSSKVVGGTLCCNLLGIVDTLLQTFHDRQQDNHNNVNLDGMAPSLCILEEKLEGKDRESTPKDY